MSPQNRPEPAYCEEQLGDSEDNQTVAATKVSATKKDEKKSSKKHRSHHRKEKKSKSEDDILEIDRSSDEVTTATRVRVIPDPEKAEKSRRRSSQASAPLTSSQSPRKHSSRPAPRERSVTFDSQPRHNKNDPEYFGRKNNRDAILQPSSRQSMSSDPRMRPSRPMSFENSMQSSPFQLPFGQPIIFSPPPAPVYSPQGMSSSYSEPNFGQNVSTLASRFGRQGQPTLNDAPHMGYHDSRRNPRRELYDEEDEEDEFDDDYDPEAERRAIAEEERRKEKRRRDKQIVREAQAVLEEKRREEQRRIQDLRAMPPPSGFPQRRSSQRPGARPPHLDFPSQEDMRERAREQALPRSRANRSSMIPERPRILQRDTEPVTSRRRDSFNSRPPPSTSSAGYELPLRRRPRPDIEVPGPRRSSFYGGTSGTGTTASSNYEDQLGAAETYQNEHATEVPPLTQDWLNKQQRQIKAGSRSTRSSASRDDSDVKQSDITQTTRSGSGDGEGNDQTTFTINGNGTVKIAGAEISTSEMNGPLEISVRNGPASSQRTTRGGSEVSFAPSGTTAVSDDIVNRRPSARRMDSMQSHQYRTSTENARYDPLPRFDLRADRVDAARERENLRDRLSGVRQEPALGRRSSHREGHRPINFEREWL